uniref:Uncharacterized protein n=1 Tax=Physcomitrium patens TaxID=3218 RepID=A0A2K1KQ30_PHYPA|nr:hypothetical protein PHYPA_006800 [Physcomitrium patens]
MDMRRFVSQTEIGEIQLDNFYFPLNYIGNSSLIRKWKLVSAGWGVGEFASTWNALGFQFYSDTELFQESLVLRSAIFVDENIFCPMKQRIVVLHQ